MHSDIRWPHMLSRLAGGTLAAALFSVPLVIGSVRRVNHTKYALVVVMTAQAANTVLETLMYEAYTFFSLNIWGIALGVGGMMLAIVLCGSLRGHNIGRSNTS